MTLRAPAPSALFRRLVILGATAAMAAVGWFLLDEPDAVEATETAAVVPTHEVLARVAGRELTRDGLRDAARDELEALEREVRERRRQILERGLESSVAELLLDAEARRRGVGREALLEAEVESKLGLVADEAVETARSEHSGADDEEIRRIIRRESFLDELRRRHRVEVYGERLADSGT